MRTVLIFLLLLCTVQTMAQNKINNYQYWFDGQYSNAISQDITAVASFTLSTQVSTQTLLNGLHVFNIKFRDDSARFSNTLSTFFYKTIPYAGTGTISEYQYWFDQNFSDAVTQAAAGNNSFTLSDFLSTPALLNGLHVLHIRFKGSTNLWTETLSHFFYKPPAAVTGTINTYQYWYDQNFAAAVTQPATGNNSFTLSENLNTAPLLNGLHVFHIRFKGNTNFWSETLSHFFYKSPAAGTGTINRYQYWFDKNYAAAVQQNLTPGTLYNLSAALPTATLLQGLHILNLRFLDNSQKWSSIVSQFFYKTTEPEVNNITSFQYWFDQDFEGSVQQNLSAAGTAIITEQLSTPALLDGLHALSLRFLDKRGKWSSTLTQFFYKEKNNPATENKISAYRYWFDERDSILNLVDIAPFMNPLLLNESIAADGMDSGQHVIHFQFRDMNGRWSMVSSDTATVIAKATYTFNGNGNWSNAANWINKMKPPASIAGTYKIFIDPVAGGQCILDVSQFLTEGAIFTVRAGKTFIIPGDLNISQ